MCGFGYIPGESRGYKFVRALSDSLMTKLINKAMNVEIYILQREFAG